MLLFAVHRAATNFPARVRNTSVLALLVLIAGCAGVGGSPFVSSSGPSARAVSETASDAAASQGIVLVEVTDDVARRALAAQHRQDFKEVFGDVAPPHIAVGAGDTLEVSVWEAPPAALFGATTLDYRMGPKTSSQAIVLPEQVVTAAGTINMPFAGTIPVAGRSLADVEQEIAKRLKGKANDPQVVVRIVRNASSNVTVVGEVATSTRMALTPRGERLLDALASAGGTRQPIGKLTVQLTRESNVNGRRVARVAALPLETIIADPAQNILLQPGDVVTALFQPNSLTVLGATARNEEVNFEAQGISLAQMLARVGGVQDQRADAAGLFIFRFEDPKVLNLDAKVRTTPDGRVPVIYKVNLKDPASFFVAQDFPMRNRDVVYVANAPAAELQKFLTLISSVVVPTVTIDNLSR